MKSAFNLILTSLICLNLTAQNDTLTSHFSDYRDVLSPTLPWGFVSGHNSYDDVSKLMKFDATYGTDTSKYIKSILFWIARTENPQPNSFALANIWSEVNGIPGTVLSNAVLSFGNIDTNFNNITHINGQAYYNAEAVLNPPLKVPSNGVFYAGVEFTASSYILQSYMFLKMTKNKSFADAETHAFDQWSDFSFQHVNNWQNDSNFAYAVFPVIGDTVNIPTKPDTVDLACDSIFEPMVGAYTPGQVSPIEFQLTNHGPDLLNAGDSIEVYMTKNGTIFSQLSFPAAGNVPAGSSVPVNLGAGALRMDTIPGSYDYCFSLKFRDDFNVLNDTSCVTITVQDTSTNVSLSELERVTTKLFPSPVSSVLNIEFALNHPDKAFIENQLGQRLTEFEINTLSPSVSLNVQGLAPGVYFLYEQRGVVHKRTKWMKR
ncbi:MAG TPA: hypothetical protein DCS15_00945 [Flavobacteriales bacterium]|nr:hypothetical protein [Flavobacteriales bacterium]